MLKRQQRVCAWAHTYTHMTEPWAVLDTETTGLGNDDEVLELAIISSTGDVLFSSLIQPQDPQRTDLATHIHGISSEMLATAPTFPQVWPQIAAIFQQYAQILVYNASFDSRMLALMVRRYGYQLPPVQWSCLMEQYAIYHGAWHDYHHSYTWQRLQVACDRLGVQVQGEYHRATFDTFCTLGVIRALAARHQPQGEA